MSRVLIKDSTIYGLGSVLTHSLGFLLIPLYTRYLSVSDYGMLSLLNATLQVVSFVCVLGISSAAMRFYFDPDADEDYQRRLYGNATVLLVVLPALVLAAAGPLVWLVVTRYLPAVPFFPYVLTILLIGLFTPLVKLMTGLLRVRRLPRAFIAFNLAFFLVETVIIIAAVAWLGFGLQGQVYSQLIANALFGLLALAILVRVGRPSFSASLTRRMLAYGVPLVPFFIFTWINTSAGRFFLERYADLDQVGIFALASQFGGLLLFFATAMDNSFVPHFLSRASQPGAPRELGILVLRYLTVFGLLGLAVVAGAGPAIRIVTTPAYHEATRYVALITLATWLFIAYKPAVWSMNHSQRTGLLSTILGCSTATLVMLLLFFLGQLQLGIRGVIYAMIAVNAFSIIAGYSVAQRNFRIEIPARPLLSNLGLLLGGGALIAWLTPDTLDAAPIAAQLAVLAAVAVATCRLAGIRGLRRLLRPAS